MVYVGDHYEKEGATIRKYYYAGGARIADRVNGTLSWLLTDHLGSTAITASATGAEVGELRYKAWGETRFTSGSTPTTWRFTGQREEAGFGLYYYRARWYDPILGRFAQADTIGGGDRYAYGNNNPLRYTDPSGHVPTDCYDGSNYCGGGSGGGGGGGGDDEDFSPPDQADRIPAFAIPPLWLSPTDLLFNPWFGHGWNAALSGDRNSFIAEAWKLYRSGMYDENVLGISFGEIVQAALTRGEDNPLPQDRLVELTPGLLGRIGHEPYDRFLEALNLGTGAEHFANYEPFFLDALMERPETRQLLEDVKFAFEISVEGDVALADVRKWLQGQGGFGPDIPDG